MSHDTFEIAGIAAVRSAGEGEHSALVAATRSRLRRSLERRARSRHRFTRAGTILLVLLVSTVSWALTTGRMPLLSRAEPAVEPVLELPKLADPAPVRRSVPQRAVPERWEPPPVEVVAPAPLPPPPKPTVVARPRPAEVLYRKAHDLHFRGVDRAAALAAWDAYLAAEPVGRFAVEARYNRALVLVRLGRYSDARAALAPFARGELGYRRAEASQLIERLDQLVQQSEIGSP